MEITVKDPETINNIKMLGDSQTLQAMYKRDIEKSKTLLSPFCRQFSDDKLIVYAGDFALTYSRIEYERFSEKQLKEFDPNIYNKYRV